MNLNLNKIVKYLIYSDLIFYTGWGLISPIFAIFIVNNIAGGNAFVVGMAAGIHLVVRSIVRLLAGVYVDKNKGLKDDYSCLVWGLFVASLVPIGYIFAKTPMHIYVLQIILGMALAISTAGWTGIFSKNMDTGKESTEWGIDAAAVGLGPGIAAALGGIAVTYFSFNLVFIAVTIVGIIGALLLLVIKKDIIQRKMTKEELLRMRQVYRLKKNHTRL